MFADTHIIADDLTGLLEAIQSLALSDVQIEISPEHALEKTRDSIRLVNANIRDAEKTEATRVIRTLTHNVPNESNLFLKVDSLLRGPIKQILSALRDLQRPIIFSPSMPARHRTISELKPYVNGVPLVNSGSWAVEAAIPPNSLEEVLPDSEYFHIPLPAIRSNSSALTSLIAEVAGENSTVVCDAETSDDLDQIVLATRDVKPKPIFVGSAGILSSLHYRLVPPWRRNAASFPQPAYQKPILFVLGSASKATLSQYESIDHKNLVIYDESLSQASLHTSFNDSKDLVIPPLSNKGTNYRSTRQRELESMVQRIPRLYNTLFITGGETAFRILNLLGITQMKCIGFADSGLAVMRDARGRTIIIKPGEYGGPDLLNVIRQGGAG